MNPYTQNPTAPLDIRAHHVESIRTFGHAPQKAISYLLMDRNYIPSLDHPFPRFVYERMREITKRRRVLRLTVGTPDLFCKECPKRQNCECIEQQVLGRAFGNPSRDIDITALNKLGLSEGQTITISPKLKVTPL